MLLLDFAIAVIFTLLITTLLASSMRGEDVTWFSAFFFLTFLYLPLIWAGGVWLRPVGPLIYDINLLGFASVALILLLFGYALMAPSGRKYGEHIIRRDEGEKRHRASNAFAFSVFAWSVLTLAFIALLMHYAGIEQPLV